MKRISGYLLVFISLLHFIVGVFSKPATLTAMVKHGI